MRVKDAVGRFGEQVAADHLSRSGFEIISRNWRCRDGEIDIVAREGTALVFVEVKTRSSVGYGVPAAAVDRRKIARIRRLSVQWLDAHRDGERFWTTVRFDVVSVLRVEPGPRIQHLRGAF